MIGLLAIPVAALAALAAAIWPWTRLYDCRRTLRALACLTVLSALVVVLQVALGAAGLLAGGPLLLLAGALAAGSGVAWRRRRRHTGPGDLRPLGDGDPAAPMPGRPTGLGLALGLLTALVYLALLGIAALVPPYGWDAVAYHLADVFQAARTGSLAPLAFPAHQFHFPKVAELHSLWFYLLAGAGGQAWRVTGVALVPLALTAGIAVRAAAEALDLRRALPWIVPAVMLTPLVLIQPIAGYTDVAFAAFLLAAFAFAIWGVRRRRPADLGFAALAAGLAMGTKISFLYLAAPILLVLASPRLARPLLSGHLLRRALLGAALFAAGCGWWLGHQLLRTGNPLYPVNVRVGSITLFQGPSVIPDDTTDRQRYVASAAGWATYPFRETFLGRLRYTTENGFGPAFAAGYVAVPCALLLALRRRDWLEARAHLALPLSVLVWLVVSPWEHPRYVLAACGFGVLAVAAVAEDAGRARTGAGRAPVGLVGLAMSAAVGFSAVSGLLAAAPELPRVVAEWRAGTWTPERYYELEYGDAGRAMNWLSAHGGPDARVSATRPTFVSPLFGWHGRSEVVYAGTLEDRAIEGVVRAADFREWRRRLAEQRVDTLVVWRDWWEVDPPLSTTERWIAAHPAEFEPLAVFGDRARIYRPRLDPAAEPADSPPAWLAELARADRWVVEYARTGRVDLTEEPGGWVRLVYRFDSVGNDYLDLRADLTESGWPAAGRLSFELDAAADPTLLFIYLKESDQRRACRFRVDLHARRASPSRVVLPLDRPDWRSPDFDVSRVAAIHLVLDDAIDRDRFSGSLRLADFRVEPAGSAHATGSVP